MLSIIFVLLLSLNIEKDVICNNNFYGVYPEKEELSTTSSIFIKGHQFQEHLIDNYKFYLSNDSNRITLNQINYYSYQNYNLIELKSEKGLPEGIDLELKLEISNLDNFLLKKTFTQSDTIRMRGHGYSDEQIASYIRDFQYDEGALKVVKAQCDKFANLFNKQKRIWKIIEADHKNPSMLRTENLVKGIKYDSYEYGHNYVEFVKIACDSGHVLYEVKSKREKIMVLPINRKEFRLYDGYCISNFRFVPGEYLLEITPIDFSGNRGETVLANFRLKGQE